MFSAPKLLDRRLETMVDSKRAKLRRHPRGVSRTDNRYREQFGRIACDPARKIAFQNCILSKSRYFRPKFKLEICSSVERYGIKAPHSAIIPQVPLFLYREIESGEWTLTPVEQARRGTMVLHQEDPFPFVARWSRDVRSGILHKTLDQSVLGQKVLCVTRQGWNEFPILERLTAKPRQVFRRRLLLQCRQHLGNSVDSAIFIVHENDPNLRNGPYLLKEPPENLVD